MRALALIVIVSLCPLAAGAPAPAAHFDSPEAAKAWSFANGPEFPGAKGSIAFDSKEGHDRPGCLAMRYSFAGGGNYVQASWPVPAENSARIMSVWLKKPAANRVTFRALDAGGQTFQKSIDYTYPGWQRLEVDLARWDAHFGGANDGKIQWPVRLLGVLVENNTEPREGVIYIDDVELSEQGPTPAVQLKPDVHELKSGLQFSVDLTNPRSSPAKGKLVCEFSGLGRRLGAKVVELELPAGAKSVRREFEFTTGDNNLVEASFSWSDAEATARPVSIGWSRIPEALPGSTQLDPSSRIGCGIYLYRWHGHPQELDKMNRQADLAQRAGIKWTREEFQWHALEPEPGKFDFAFYDRLVDVAQAHGISVYGLLAYWSKWAKANTPEGLEAYSRWARAVVHHFKGRIKYWEIWNEPNIFFWTGPREMYAALLEQAYTAIKAEDPQAVVMGCSTSGIDTKFIKMVMEKKAHFDALSIHPYRGALNDLAYIDDLRAAHELVGGRDVWLTEIGFPSQAVTGFSERGQASLAARTYLLSLASGAIRDVSWYDFRNDGEDINYNEHNFGVVRGDFRPKPAYRALATTCRTLAGLQVKERIDVGAGAYAFRFGGGKLDVIAACSPDKGRLLSFETDAELKIIDGVDQPVKPRQDGKRLTVALDAGFPVYLTAKVGFAFKTVDPPLQLTAEPASVHAGESIQIRLSPTQDVKRWDLPHGWAPPKDVGSGVHLYKLDVPTDAAAGETEIQAFIGDGEPLRVPVIIRVAPAVIRL